jgi:hypothetical protein
VACGASASVTPWPAPRVQVCLQLGSKSKVIFTTGRRCAADEDTECAPTWAASAAAVATSEGKALRDFAFDRQLCVGSFLRLSVCENLAAACTNNTSCDDAALETRLVSFAVDGTQYKPMLRSLATLVPPGIFGCVSVTCSGTDGSGCCREPAGIDVDHMLPGTEIVFGPIGSVPVTAIAGSVPRVTPCISAVNTGSSPPANNTSLAWTSYTTAIGDWGEPGATYVTVPEAGMYLVTYQMAFQLTGTEPFQVTIAVDFMRDSLAVPQLSRLLDGVTVAGTAFQTVERTVLVPLPQGSTIGIKYLWYTASPSASAVAVAIAPGNIWGMLTATHVSAITPP